MKHFKLNTLRFVLMLVIANLVIVGCSSENDDATTTNTDQGNGNDTPTEVEKNFFLGIEAATDPATEVLVPATSLSEGEVSPVNNGFEQSVWMSYFSIGNKIITGSYANPPVFTSYQKENGKLAKGGSFSADLGVYAFDAVDDNTLIMMGSARKGQSAKKLYKVNVNTMSIENTVIVDFGNDPDNKLMAFPVDLKVRGDKLFAAYYMKDEESFKTPDANQARIAVFSYPELVLEKIITDDRAPNLGRYFTFNALESAENGDIYTYASSSLACGFAPTPSKNSAILRIKNGATEFDPDYYIDFEALSNGYKINDLFYVGNGKAVVRVLKEDETNEQYLWGTYAPVSEIPLLETGIVDLNAKTFTLLPDVPKSGGGWSSPVLKHDNKFYIGVNAKNYADIYEIDVEAGTSKKGAKIKGNYAKNIMYLD